jgi:hypothetical protein
VPLTPRDILLREGMSPADHTERFFLDSSELPPGMELLADSEFSSPPAYSFARFCRGEWFGRMMWLDKATGAQIMDLRWLFPDDADADGFLTGGLRDLSEKFSQIPLPSPLHESGTPGYLFGQAAEATADTLAYLTYVFRSGRAVVKVFIARRDEIPECIRMLEPLIPQIEARLEE